MATTDQLQKAQQRVGLQLNDFPKSKYVSELKKAGFNTKSLTKVEAYRLIKLHSIPVARSCTCHPDDSPPVPCAKQYALTACRAVALPRPPSNSEAK